MQFKIDPEQLLREIPGKQKLGYANALIYITKRYKNCSESMVRAKWAIYCAWVLLLSNRRELCSGVPGCEASRNRNDEEC